MTGLRVCDALAVLVSVENGVLDEENEARPTPTPTPKVPAVADEGDDSAISVMDAKLDEEVPSVDKGKLIVCCLCLNWLFVLVLAF